MRPKSVLLLILIILPVFLYGCARRDDRKIITDQLHQAQTAQQQIMDHWDRLMQGQAINCQQGLPMVTAIDRQQISEPATVLDHLNQGIALLNESAHIWDEICANGEIIIPNVLISQGYQTAHNAQIELESAEAGLNVWEP